MRRLLILALLFSCTVSAQQQITAADLEIERAQLAFDSRKYTTAANLYRKVFPKIKEETKQNEVLYMIAESYRRANNFKQAYEWYEKLVNTKYPDPKIIYSYGLLLKNYERYEDAARQFSDYLFEVPNDAAAKREQQSCAMAQEWKNNPGKFDVKPMTNLNTMYSDYAPGFASGKLIWASSRPEATGNEIFEWTGQKCSDLFESVEQEGKWSKPKGLKGSVNTNFNDGAAWLDLTGTTMYTTQCNGMDGRGMNCKIYESHFNNGAWSIPLRLPFCSDSFSVGHPAMTADGTKLYFASDMPGGYGEKDLYVIEHNPNTESWGKMVNLGPAINTKEDDMFPSLNEKGELYFASKGHPGMGGLDLFRAIGADGHFTEAVNMKYPVNSGGDDFGITFVPSTQIKEGSPFAYYSSNRVGGIGDDDIYSLTIKPYLFLVKGVVTDLKTNQPLVNAHVELKDNKGKTLFNITTNAKGEYGSEIPAGKECTMMASQTGYFSSARTPVSSVGLSKDSAMQLNFMLDMIPAEDVEFVLQGIFYDLDKFDLRPRSKQILDSLILILNNNPGIVIELASHTDSRAPADYNLKLSQKRAQECVNYLVDHGINKSRLVAVGYGETHLVNDCADGVDCSEEEHQQNRRTTIRVLRKE